MPDQQISKCFMPTKEGKPCGGKIALHGHGDHWYVICEECCYTSNTQADPQSSIDLHNLMTERLEASTWLEGAMPCKMAEMDLSGKFPGGPSITFETPINSSWTAGEYMIVPVTRIETGITPNTVDEIRAACNLMVWWDSTPGKLINAILDQASRGELEKI